MIRISKIVHNGNTRILLCFDKDEHIISLIKSLEGVSYSKTFTGWYLPYTKEYWNAFLKLNLTYKIEDTGTTGSAMPLSDDAGKKIAESPQTCTEQAADTTPISIRYVHPYFYVRGQMTQGQIIDIKKIHQTYWNPNYRNWVMPATEESLNMFYQGLKVISRTIFEQWLHQLSSITDPKVCTMYRSPEYPNKVLVQLKGHGIDVEFLKHIPERQYQRDQKYWVIPDDPKVITRISDHYLTHGTKVINRIKTNHLSPKKTGYAELKNHLLSKSDDHFHYAAIPYLDTLITQRYSIATIREYYQRFMQFSSAVWPCKCDEISETQVNEYLCEMSSTKVSQSLINSYINAIKFYYQKVIYLPQFKIEHIKRPRKGHYLPKVLSVQQVNAMLKATENMKHIAMLFALYGHGIRLNELLGIRIDDLLWDRNQVFVHQGKGNKDRYVPMSQQFKAVMQTYIHEYKPQYWLFEGQDQMSQYSERSVQKVVSNAASKAGISIKVTPHMLRHSYATHLLDARTQLPYIKELLGHKDIKTTMIYTHVTTASIENVVSPLDRLLDGK